MWRAAPAVLLAGVLGCSSTDRAPFLGDYKGRHPSTDGGSGAPLDIPPPLPPAPDAGGLCGNIVVPIATEPLNLYFIVDMSGSMDFTMPLDTVVNGVLYKRYQSARNALQTVLRAVGHRVSYGATWFPSDVTEGGCTPGNEFFKTRPGDAQSYAVTKKHGPVLASFLSRFDTRAPYGGTPTAETIAQLQPKLVDLPGKTIAFLITDGAPTCSQSTCGKDRCTVNIERACPDTSMNCCDPDLGGTYGNCLDDDASVSAIAELAEAGVPTIVFGMPGTDAYADTLNRMATAGGAPRAASPYYYSVKSTTELSDTLRDVGIAVSITCDATFETPPPDPRLVNVFFDQTLVPLDPENGWSWDGDRRIVLSGSSCENLKNGDVGRLQVVAGCPSISR
jgi:hypothetical protein